MKSSGFSLSLEGRRGEGTKGKREERKEGKEEKGEQGNEGKGRKQLYSGFSDLCNTGQA